jgi:type III secretion system FlhB-like substrate exporter
MSKTIKHSIKEEELLSELEQTEIIEAQNHQMVEDVIEDKIYKVCANMVSYIKQYQTETALPFSEYLDYASIHDYIRYTGTNNEI